MQEIMGNANIIETISVDNVIKSVKAFGIPGLNYILPNVGSEVVITFKPGQELPISKVAFPNTKNNVKTAIVTITPADKNIKPITYTITNSNVPLFTNEVTPIKQVSIKVTEINADKYTNPQNVQISLQSCSHLTTVAATTTTGTFNYINLKFLVKKNSIIIFRIRFKKRY